MTPIVYDFVVDIINYSKYFIVPIPQGDIGTRYIDVTVVENGQPYSYPQSASYSCIGTNGAGNGVSVTCSLVGGKVRIPISNAMTSYAGIGNYRVEIIADNQIKASFKFHLSIEAAPEESSQIVASDDYQNLADLISVAQNYNKWIIDAGAPSSSVGENLDLYLNTTNQSVYQKIGGTWTYKCTLGTNMYIAYADDAQGTNFSTTYTNQSYLGICSSQSATQPTTPSSYTWIMISGGDNMKVSDYGGSDSNTVARADYIKGETVISDIAIPVNTTTATTTVTITNEAIGTSSVIEGIYTTTYGLNPLSVTLTNGSMTLVFPALSTASTAMVKIWNVGNYLYPTPMEWNDSTVPTRETVDIDFPSEFSV